MPRVMMAAPLLATGSGAVALVCLALGFALIVSGTAHGIAVSRRESKVAQVTGELEAAQRRFHDTRDRLESMQVGGLEAAGADLAGASSQLHRAAVEAESTADAAKTAVEQISGVVGALPENLRFSGLLLLVGTVLVSVATIQFGGTSLF
jgi:hypothetical protein